MDVSKGGFFIILSLQTRVCLQVASHKCHTLAGIINSSIQTASEEFCPYLTTINLELLTFRFLHLASNYILFTFGLQIFSEIIGWSVHKSPNKRWHKCLNWVALSTLHCSIMSWLWLSIFNTPHWRPTLPVMWNVIDFSHGYWATLATWKCGSCTNFPRGICLAVIML